MAGPLTPVIPLTTRAPPPLPPAPPISQPAAAASAEHSMAALQAWVPGHPPCYCHPWVVARVHVPAAVGQPVLVTGVQEQAHSSSQPVI
jgi:hypothetical protein